MIIESIYIENFRSENKQFKIRNKEHTHLTVIDNLKEVGKGKYGKYY